MSSHCIQSKTPNLYHGHGALYALSSPTSLMLSQSPIFLIHYKSDMLVTPSILENRAPFYLRVFAEGYYDSQV